MRTRMPIKTALRPTKPAIGSDTPARSVTLCDVLHGIGRLPPGRRREELRSAATEVFQAFAEQVLAFDTAAAGEYALLVSHRERLGLPVEGFDAQIAAICRVRGAALATRNVSDFRETGINVINPWDDRS